MRIAILTCLVLGAAGGVLFAADDAKQPTTYTLHVRPVATTRPALAHRLLPSLIDQTPGDAAPLYLVASTLWTRETNSSDKADAAAEALAKKFGLKEEEGGWSPSEVFLKAPLDKLPSPELTQYIAEQNDVLNLVEAASKRESCHWDMAFREQGFATLLPHLQAMRGIGRAVCIRARAHLAHGEITLALRTLRTNFAMCRALNEQAVLIQSLVSASIASQTLAVLREVEEHADSPNMFWPLVDLPRPMCSIATGMEWERASVFFSIPALNRVREGRFSDADWRETVERMKMLTGSTQTDPDLLKQFEAAGMAMMIYPQARTFFLGKGMTAEQVDAMPHTLAIARFYTESLLEMYDELTKWSRLPYWQAHPGLLELDKELKAKRTNPMMVVMPSITRAMFQLTRLDREIAAMQTLEAVRDYAARHDGALPKSLEEITATPTPIDPIWGKPFEYKAEGTEFTLSSAAPPGNGPKDALVIKVTLSK